MSKSVTAWLQKKITVLPWSLMNLDLNLIESLWQDLKVKINHQSPKKTKKKKGKNSEIKHVNNY